ncbi:MAG: 4-(cytidine 5'-diphospho)-2-C-methyl-D-erythritol kinase [SAR86 cluster bacterium]|uniref:4-diphosphocytidyl-2-C-methyl-D-erythritol kinase n=1 Tax=SAR86 cluster bacterium TaxID=2030880 RepID=A0A2A4MWH2_9GAMM|nr:MAG: 4-(cytidine 5'-diphospho)-2-C-methyl-D-erythritol kinase [SAR86 cluster bacterium]
MPASETNNTLTLLSPAKLNLFLHITGRRADGYHNLQTLFQLLDYGDSLSFRLDEGEGIALHSNNGRIPMDANLIILAADKLRHFAEMLAKDKGMDSPNFSAVEITLDKRLPMGAGLGGGSANAATTLLALNQLWQLNFSKATLAQIGLSLGADIPLFILGKSAWAEGVGEILQAIELPQRHYLVLTPHCEISTVEIFSHQQLTRDSSAIRMADFLDQLESNWIEQHCRNDCQKVSAMLYPEVDEALKWLHQYAPSRMTGTGASVFASFSTEQAAQEVLQNLPDNMSGFVAKGINSLE